MTSATKKATGKATKQTVFTPPRWATMPFDDEAVKFLEILSLAEVVKESWIATDRLPPLALHDYIRIPKGTVVGLIDDIFTENDLVWNGGSLKVRAYFSDGVRYSLAILDMDSLKPLKGS